MDRTRTVGKLEDSRSGLKMWVVMSEVSSRLRCRREVSN